MSLRSSRARIKVNLVKWGRRIPVNSIGCHFLVWRIVSSCILLLLQFSQTCSPDVQPSIFVEWTISPGVSLVSSCLAKWTNITSENWTLDNSTSCLEDVTKILAFRFSVGEAEWTNFHDETHLILWADHDLEQASTTFRMSYTLVWPNNIFREIQIIFWFSRADCLMRTPWSTDSHTSY